MLIYLLSISTQSEKHEEWENICIALQWRLQKLLKDKDMTATTSLFIHTYYGHICNTKILNYPSIPSLNLGFPN